MTARAYFGGAPRNNKPKRVMDLRVLVPEDKRQAYVLFYKPTPSDPVLNHAVAFVNGPFSHCEIALPERVGEAPWDRVVWGSSIYQGEPVFFRPKTYQRDGYVSIALEVSFAQMNRLRAFCRYHAERKTPFSLAAMYAAFLPVQLFKTSATFCSKHVAEALISANVIDPDLINPALMTPSRLYQRLSRVAILQIVPSRMTVRGGRSSSTMREPPKALAGT